MLESQFKPYKHLIQGIITTLLVMNLSCQKNDENYILNDLPAPFNSIELYSSIDVLLIEDSVYSIKFVGREDIVKGIEYDVTDSVLKIEDPRKSEWRTPKSNKVILHITSPNIKRLTTFEACNIATNSTLNYHDLGLILGGKANEVNLDINCKTFYYWGGSVTGGKISLSGNTEQLKLWNTGLIQVDASQLKTNYCLIENKSRGNCEVEVIDKLDYSILNTGDIILHGNPSIINELEIDNTATGRLIHK
jgi:hypothetical protein